MKSLLQVCLHVYTILNVHYIPTVRLLMKLMDYLSTVPMVVWKKRVVLENTLSTNMVKKMHVVHIHLILKI